MARRLIAKPARYGGIYTPEYEEIVATFGEILIEAHEGSYQGDSKYLVKKGDLYGIVTFGWGSCSGCDALQACNTQEDIDQLQDDLERGIVWFSDLNDVWATVDPVYAPGVSYHPELDKEFAKKVAALSTIVIQEKK